MKVISNNRERKEKTWEIIDPMCIYANRMQNFEIWQFRSSNVKCYSIRLPIVPRSTAQHPLTTKPISNPSLSSLDQRPLTFHHPNSFHSKCKGPNQQIPFETKSILIKRITIISFLKRRNKDHAESFMPASANVILNYRTMIVY